MMRMRTLSLFTLCLLLIRSDDSVAAQTEWNGDPNVCTVNSSKTVSLSPLLPNFSNEAQFTIETVTKLFSFGVLNPPVVTRIEYIYDYTKNVMIKSTHAVDSVQLSYHDYSTLKKRTYSSNKVCDVTDIPQNIDSDGESAIQLDDGRWHIRPLNELLSFSSQISTAPSIIPTYSGQSMIRGIAVDQWEFCSVDKINAITIRRLWSFAANKTVATSNEMNASSVPIHLSAIESVSSSNGTVLIRVDMATHVIAFQPKITADSTRLLSPKGVFCPHDTNDPSMVTLSEMGIAWPPQFSVRIDASTSRTDTWQTFKYYFYQSSLGTFLRYDYSPNKAEHTTTLILDLTHNLTYTIDQQTGTCDFDAGEKFVNVNPLYKPIEFFMENEHFLVRDPPKKWSFDGIQACRGEEISCVIVRTSIDQYPPQIADDTGESTGDVWSKTNIEYGWSVRSPFTSTISGGISRFDYPVSLFMRLYQSDNAGNDSDTDIKTEEVEYQFYDMSPDVRLDDFDFSSCYRTLGLPYLHLAIVLLPIDNRLLIGVPLDRQMLEFETHRVLSEQSRVTASRISNIQIELIQSGNSVYVFFTLLDRPAFSAATETSMDIARENLQNSIDSGAFTVNTALLGRNQSLLALRAVAQSLKPSAEFMSIHSNWPLDNVSACNISSTNFTNTNFSQCNSSTVNVSIIYREKIINEKYTTAAELGGVFGGLVVGIVVGFISILLIRWIRKRNSGNATSIRGNTVINPNSNRSSLPSAIPMTNFDQRIRDQDE